MASADGVSKLSERFAARRVLGWEQHDRVVTLTLEGSAAPQTDDATAPTDEASLAITVLETGAIRLVLDTGTIRAVLGDDGPRGVASSLDPDAEPAPLGVTAAPAGLTIASERHGGFGPDPEDVAVEVGTDPFTLAIVDANGRRVFALAGAARADEPDSEDAVDDLSAIDTGSPLPHPAPLAWSVTPDGRASASIAFAIEADERLYGFGQRDGPDDLVGSARELPDRDSADGAEIAGPPLLLSSRGYGALIATHRGLRGDFAATAPGVGVVTANGPLLDVFVFPTAWPRAALAASTTMTGLADLPQSSAFGLQLGSPGRRAGDREAAVAAAHGTGIPCEPADAQPTARGTSTAVAAPAAELRRALAAGLVAPGFWHASVASADLLARSPAAFARQAQAALLGPMVSVDTRVFQGASDLGAAQSRALAIVARYARLRYRLLPYLLHCARESAAGGLPMLRPLLLEFSWDSDAAARDDQYLLGRDLLVAPVLGDGDESVTRRVYLPAFAHWYDWWTGALHEGGRGVDVAAPPDRLPMFARAGTAIPLADPRMEIGDGSIDVTRLLLFMPSDGAIGASVELPDGDLMGVEQARGPKRAKVYIEGLPPTVRDLQIVGLPATSELVDAASPRVAIVGRPDALHPIADDLIPAPGTTAGGIVVALDPGAYTTGLELRW